MVGNDNNIDHTLLLRQLNRMAPECDVMRLLTQVIYRTAEWGGTFREMRIIFALGRIKHVGSVGCELVGYLETAS